ncbi:TonB-dependent siderophore receptor [Pseudomonas japonica]|uniref:Outer-membrane receptor for ferric coprogen and ferric-rhodotorulic acid n=1 Tax=Pseudomonas japonica TaxID=256466 RepID=A0A239CXF2_9PSED|nr:TonB-dependent receptor [Pseudomonas japonica]SNS24936.1 outer-membrane receptor for ferric coprogen and ferric-rhodotorulic acid [Pseudomonas japonica]
MKGFSFNGQVRAIAASSALWLLAPQLVQAAEQVQAQPAARQYQLDIPAGPLPQAIAALSLATGQQLLYSNERIFEQHSPAALRGRYSLEQALDILLRGTGLQWRRSSANVLTIDNAPSGDALELGATPVTAVGLSGITENTGSYNADQVAVGSKTAKSVREVPHSVSVVTRQRIEEQNLTTLTDALDKTTGVTLQRNGASGSSLGNDSNFFSRGFAVSNIQIDGGAPLDTTISGYGSTSQLDLAQFDHVEFLRGVDGLYSGSGNPGGTINLVRKRALPERQLTFSASAGSWDTYRTELDATGPLTEQGNIRGRLGMAYQDNRYFYDVANMNKQLVYGALEFDLTPDTLLTVGGSYQTGEGVANFGGLPRYTNGDDIKLPRRTALVTSWDTVDETTKQAYLKLEHAFNADWSWTTDITWMDMDRDANSLFANGGIDPLTGDGARWLHYPAKTGLERKAINTYVKGNFDLLGRSHELLLGGDYAHSKGYTVQRWGNDNFAPFNLFDFTRPEDTGSTANKTDDNVTEKYAGYGMVRLSLADPVKLILGGRLSSYHYHDTQIFQNEDGSYNSDSILPTFRVHDKFTPYAGLTYDLDEQWTTYVSYAETYKPQFQQVKGPAPGTPLGAVTSKNYELGLKGQLFDGRLDTSFAIYRIEQEGAAIQDPNYPMEYGVTTCCYLNQGMLVSEGFDAEISGEVAEGFNLFAGYTYNHSVDQKSDESRAIYSGVTPKHLFKLWGTYQLPGVLERFKVGAGVTAQSVNYRAGQVATFNEATQDYSGPKRDYKFSQAGYAVWNSSVEYRIDQNWSATLNANNLLDKRYYQTVGTSDNGNFYGEPRNFVLTVRSRF